LEPSKKVKLYLFFFEAAKKKTHCPNIKVKPLPQKNCAASRSGTVGKKRKKGKKRKPARGGRA